MRANWFEIPVLDMSRARTFYATIFNVEMVEPFEMNESKCVSFTILRKMKELQVR